jgi:hypothetical protein
MSAVGAKPVLVLCRDLLFTSKITAAAQSVGVSVSIIRDPTKLAEAAGDAMIVDLNQDGFLEPAADWKQRTGGQLTGFVGHVHTDIVARARALGFDNVIPRGAFNARLGEILVSSAAPTSSAPDHPSAADKP